MHTQTERFPVKNSDERQDGAVRFAAVARCIRNARQHIGLIIGMLIAATLLAVGSFGAGYHFGAASEHPMEITDTLPPIHDSNTVPTIPPRVCGAPSPLNPGTDTEEPSETVPTTPCVPPAPDVIVLLGAAKAKALPANVGGIDCEMTDPYGDSTDYSACDPQPAKDAEPIAKKLLTPEQLTFVNDHVLSRDAYWAFDIKDTATLKNQFMVPGASYDENFNTITVYVW